MSKITRSSRSGYSEQNSRDGRIGLQGSCRVAGYDVVRMPFRDGRPTGEVLPFVSGWLRAASLAVPGGVPVSSHLYPELSAHLLAVTPTCHWLEYVDWAAPVLTR